MTDWFRPGIRRCQCVRPVFIPSYRQPGRVGAYPHRRTTPRPVAGPHQRSPSRLHHLGGISGDRGETGGEPH